MRGRGKSFPQIDIRPYPTIADAWLADRTEHKREKTHAAKNRAELVNYIYPVMGHRDINGVMGRNQPGKAEWYTEKPCKALIVSGLLFLGAIHHVAAAWASVKVFEEKLHCYVCKILDFLSDKNAILTAMAQNMLNPLKITLHGNFFHCDFRRTL